jgi:hypothetical protein
MSRMEKHGSTFIALGCAALIALIIALNAGC